MSAPVQRKALQPIDVKAMFRPVPPSEKLSVWPSPAATARSTQIGSVTLPAIAGAKASNGGATPHLEFASGPSYLTALRAKLRRLAHIAQNTETNSPLPEHDSDDGNEGPSVEKESPLVKSSLLRLECLREVHIEMGKAFKTYAPLFDDMNVLIGLICDDVLALRAESTALHHDYGVAEEGIAKLVVNFQTEKSALQRTIDVQAKEIAAMREELRQPTVMRRELEALERQTATLSAKLAAAQADAEHARIQSVSKSVTVGHMEADRERTNEIINNLRREIEEASVRYAKLRCDGEIMKIEAEKHTLEACADRDRALQELRSCRSHLMEAQRTIAEFEDGTRMPLTSKKARPGLKIINQSTEPGFDWSRVTSNRELPDLFEYTPEGNQGRHISDMTEAERIKHILSLWRKYRTQLKLADEFIALHGLKREPFLVQDVNAPLNDTRTPTDVTISPAMVHIRNLARFEAARGPQPVVVSKTSAHHHGKGGDKSVAADALMSSLMSVDCYFQPLLDDAVTSIAPAPSATPSPVTSPAMPSVAASRSPVPAYMHWTHSGPVVGLSITTEDAVEEVRDLFAFYRKCRASNPETTVATAMQLWLVSSKYTHDARRRIGFAYSLWFTVEREACSSEAPIEFILLVSMYNGDVPSDFLLDFDKLTHEIRMAFRRRAGKNPSITRAALQSVLRRCVAWYDTEDFEQLLNAADATITFASASMFDEATLLNPAGAFLRVLCLQHLCQTLSFTRAMVGAIEKIAPTTAAAVISTRLLADGVVPTLVNGKSDLARRRKSELPPSASGHFVNPPPAGARAGANPPNVTSPPIGGRTTGPSATTASSPGTVVLPPSVSAAAAVEMITFGDALRALTSVDPDKPRADHIAFLLKALSWSTDAWAQLLPSRNSSDSVPDSPKQGSPTVELLAEFDTADALEKKRKQLLADLSAMWIEKHGLIAGIKRITERRVTSVPTWSFVRQLPTEVFGVKLAVSAQPSLTGKVSGVVAANRLAAAGGGGSAAKPRR